MELYKPKLIILLFIILADLQAFSQAPPPFKLPTIIPPAPNAASLGVYGDVPVSVYAGLPNISIPIYDIKEGSVVVPISLGYHGGGVRIKEEASWVGLGWALNAGGVITKTVRGKDDLNTATMYFNSEYPITPVSGTVLPHCTLPADGWSNGEYLGYFNSSASNRERYDFQPDIYYYNFLGYSGKFMIDQEAIFHVIGKQENIEINFIDAMNKTSGFKIRTPDGTEFRFNSGIDASIVSSNTVGSTMDTYSYSSSWKLTNIVSATGDAISFEYDFQQSSTQSQFSTVKVQDANFYWSSITCLKEDNYANLMTACQGNSGILSQTNTSTVTVEHLLSKISFRNGYLRFYASAIRTDISNTYKLDSIIVYNNEDQALHKYAFKYSYLSSYTYPVYGGTPIQYLYDQTDTKLLLLSFQESGRPPYNLHYNNHLFASKNQLGDAWGYNNYIVANKSNNGLYGGEISAIKSPKEIWTEAMKSGILERIDYPTGGHTNLEYEANSYYEAGINYNIPYVNVNATYNTAASINDNNKTITIEGETSAEVIAELQVSYTFPPNFCTTPQDCQTKTLDVLHNLKVRVGSHLFKSSDDFEPIPGQHMPIDNSVVKAYKLILQPGTYDVKIELPTTTSVNINAFVKVHYYKEKFGGGLRVKRIVDQDLTTAKEYNIQEFVYGKEATQMINGSVRTVESIPFGRAMSRLLTRRQYTMPANNSCGCSRTEVYEQSIIPLGVSSGGNNIGYDSVIVFKGLNRQGGKIVTSFTNVPDFDFGTNYPNIPNISNPNNGATLQERTYNSSNQIVKNITNTYSLKQRNVFYGNIISVNPLMQALKHEYENSNCAGGEPPPCFSDLYYVISTPIFSDWNVLESARERVYSSIIPTDYTEKFTSYHYDNALHKLPTQTVTINSKGNTITKIALFPSDYSDITGFIGNLKTSFIHNKVIEEVLVQTTPGNVTTILAGRISKYKTDGKGLLDENKTLETGIPLNLSSFKFSNQGTTGTLAFAGAPTAFNPDGKYQSSIMFDGYDYRGNIVQVHKTNDVNYSYLWDYEMSYATAQIVGADSASVAFSSFESTSSGRWNIASAIRINDGITGNKCYQLSNGSISKTGLNGTASYLLSYWTKNTTPFYISGTQGSPTSGQQINGWTYFEHKLSGITQVTIPSTSGLIDEVRLYPTVAQMTTYTYDPLIGMTSQCDINNRIQYYEYDGLGRLARIRDADKNIGKQFEYNYGSCGSNCTVLPMVTLIGTNTISYPVGVFNVDGKLLGNAEDQVQFANKWNDDVANQAIGTITVGSDPLHFNFTVNSGATIPTGVTGCRYFQFDLPYTQIDAVTRRTAAYIDFGDGTGMPLGKTINDNTGAILAPNTTEHDFGSNVHYYVHTYPNNSLKILTFYHNDEAEAPYLDNVFNPATSLMLIRNLRGTYPQNAVEIGGSCYQQPSAQSVANIWNWNSITNIKSVSFHNGDSQTPSANLDYAQDFMANNKGLEFINTAHYGADRTGYRDLTFKISRLKSDWNTYFTQLKEVIINDDHWDRENLSGLKQLNKFILSATRENHLDDPNSPYIPIPSEVINNVLNQISAGSGQYVSNGIISIVSRGNSRTDSSDISVNHLKSKGWTIYVNDIVQ